MSSLRCTEVLVLADDAADVLKAMTAKPLPRPWASEAVIDTTTLTRQCPTVGFALSSAATMHVLTDAPSGR
jgi:hypothetical protein